MTRQLKSKEEVTSLDELLEQQSKPQEYRIFYVMAYKLEEELADPFDEDVYEIEMEDTNKLIKDIYVNDSELEEIKKGKYPWIEDIKNNWDADVLSQEYIDKMIALNETILGYVVFNSSNKVIMQTGLNIINFDETCENNEKGRYMSIHTPHSSCGNYVIIDTQNGNFLFSPYGRLNKRESHIETFKNEEAKTNQNIGCYEPEMYFE